MNTVTKMEIIYAENTVNHAAIAHAQAQAIHDEMVEIYETELLANYKKPADFITEGVDIGGTSAQGEVIATREEMLKTFGAPSFCDWDSGDKTTIEWDIFFTDGTVATIYDYKRIECGEESWAVPMFDPFRWYIGGNSPRAVDMVKASLAKAIN